MSQKANNLIERLKSELSIKKDKDLCILLDIKHNTLSTWKKRDTLDFNKILALCEEHNLDLNYIFFEEENLLEQPEQKPLPKKLKVKRKTKLDHFYSTSLVSTNRNIALFYNQVETAKEKLGEIIVGQRVSINKIIEDSLYVFEDATNNFYLDTFLFVKETTSAAPILFLKDNERKFETNKIINIWQVLEKPTNVLKFIEELDSL